MAPNIFMQFGVMQNSRLGIILQYGFSDWTNYSDIGTCTEAGPQTCDENTYDKDVPANNIQTGCQCVWGAYSSYSPTSSATASTPSCSTGATQREVQTRTSTGYISSYAYDTKTTCSCGTYYPSTPTGTYTFRQSYGNNVTSCTTQQVCSNVYTLNQVFTNQSTCTPFNYGCPGTNVRKDCRINDANGTYDILYYNCSVECTNEEVCSTSCSYTGTYTATSSSSSCSGLSAPSGYDCYSSSSCTANYSSAYCTYSCCSSQTLSYGTCSGTTTTCNSNTQYRVTCNSYSGSSCNWGSYTSWATVSSCTSASPSCSSGAVQRQCQTRTRTGQEQYRTRTCIETAVEQ